MLKLAVPKSKFTGFLPALFAESRHAKTIPI